MTDGLGIAEVSVATVSATLPSPVVFGDWVMTTREFAVVRIRLRNGTTGWAFTLTRDGAVAEQIRKTIAPIYQGTSVADREGLFWLARRRSLASHSNGIGLRALSLLDLACWDAAAKSEELSIAALLGGKNAPMPATAIVGYPPAELGPDQVAQQVRSLHEEGWRRFKLPMSSTLELSAARLRAARLAAPDAWLGCDAAWMFDDADAAAHFLDDIADVGLAWFEDIFPPGNVAKLRQLRRKSRVPLAMGDEQGGSYYPQALIDAEAVDAVRIDLTCMGGITGGRDAVRACEDGGVAFAPHMFAHVHSQVFAALGYDSVPIEWGVPWTGVDPYADSLRQPEIRSDGRMEALAALPGFGPLINYDWVASQPHDDPDSVLVKR